MNDFDMNGSMPDGAQEMEFGDEIRLPRPFFEDRIRNAFLVASQQRMGGRDETDPFEVCDWLCEEFDLHSEVRDMAQAMTTPVSSMLRGQHHLPECIAGISIYISLHLLGQADNVEDLWAGLSHASVRPEHIRSTWGFLYVFRMELVVPAILPGLAKHHMERIQAFLPTPDREDVIANSGGNDRESRVRDQRDHRMVDSSEPLEDNHYSEIHRRLDEILDADDLLATVEHISEEVMDNLCLQATTSWFPAEWNLHSEQVQEAVCTFIACHLMGVEISYREAARVYDVTN